MLLLLLLNTATVVEAAFLLLQVCYISDLSTSESLNTQNIGHTHNNGKHCRTDGGGGGFRSFTCSSGATCCCLFRHVNVPAIVPDAAAVWRVCSHCCCYYFRSPGPDIISPRMCTYSSCVPCLVIDPSLFLPPPATHSITEPFSICLFAEYQTFHLPHVVHTVLLASVVRRPRVRSITYARSYVMAF